MSAFLAVFSHPAAPVAPGKWRMNVLRNVLFMNSFGAYYELCVCISVGFRHKTRLPGSRPLRVFQRMTPNWHSHGTHTKYQHLSSVEHSTSIVRFFTGVAQVGSPTPHRGLSPGSRISPRMAGSRSARLNRSSRSGPAKSASDEKRSQELTEGMHRHRRCVTVCVISSRRKMGLLHPVFADIAAAEFPSH